MYNHHMILDLPYILETRRNHALEHATLHVLAQTHHIPMAGHSNPTGFFLLGDLAIEEIQPALQEAMDRLKLGEKELAVHPGCGTNLVASTLLPATLAWIPLRGTKSTRWRLILIPLALTFAVLGYFLSKSLGPWLQANVTTEADLGDMKVVEIDFVRKGVHRVVTK